MVSALYAVLGALLLIKFSFDVVRLRMQYRVGYGDGGFSELQIAIRVHGNERRANLDDSRLRYFADCRTPDALLRFPSSPVPLATFWNERHLVLAVADGAG